MGSLEAGDRTHGVAPSSMASLNSAPLKVTLDDTASEEPLTTHLTKLERPSTLRTHTSWLIAITLCLLPAILLAAFTPQLSAYVGRSGCLPNGDFILPSSSSIWASDLFFIPSLGFAVGGTRATSGLTVVRVVDIIWDLAVARGGQAVLAWVAYRVFRAVFQAQMRSGEVGYDVFSEVALHTGAARSLPPLWRRAFGKLPLPRTSGARRTHCAMAIVTVYLLAMPTLFAAMTGYASVPEPSIDMSGLQPQENFTQNRFVNFFSADTQSCEGALLPAFGIIQHTCTPLAYPNDADIMSKYREEICLSGYLNDAPAAGIADFTPITYPRHPWTCNSYDYLDYYQRYRDVYQRCPQVGNDSVGYSPAPGCEAMDVESYIQIQCQSKLSRARLDPPLLNLTLFRGDLETLEQREQSHEYLGYSCAGQLIRRPWLTGGSSQYVEGICMASTDYAWGFSFHLVFLTSILSGVVVAILYSLWLYAYRLVPDRVETSTFLDAALMTSSAQQRFGANVHEWKVKQVDDVILKGEQGIGDPDGASYLRLRNIR